MSRESSEKAEHPPRPAPHDAAPGDPDPNGSGSDGAGGGSGSDGAGDDSGSGLLSLDKRKTAIGVIFAVLLAGAAFTAISQLTRSGEIHRAINDSHKLWLIPALVGQLMAYVGYMYAYHAAARASGGPRFDYRTTARIVIFGSGMALIAASVGGLAVDFWALRRTGTSTDVAARRVLAVGTLEWTVLSVYAWTAAILVLVFGLGHAPLVMSLAWLLVVPACVAGAIFFTQRSRVGRFINPPPLQPHPDAGRLTRALAWVHRRARHGLADGIAGVVFLRHLLSHPVRYYGAAIGYPIYWAGDMLTLYAAVHMFGFAPDLASLILAYATGIVISSLPLPAGGAGGVEATVAFALHGTGVPLPAALLGVFVYRIITFWLPVVPTLSLLPTIRRLNDKLPKIPHTRPDRDEGISFRPSSSAEAADAA